MELRQSFIMLNMMVNGISKEELADELINALEMSKMFPDSKEHADKLIISLHKMLIKTGPQNASYDDIINTADKLEVVSNIMDQLESPESN